MTDAEAIGRAVIEKKQIMESLKSLRIKADHYGQNYFALGQLLKNDPAGVVFDEQVSRVGVMKGHFNSPELDLASVKQLVSDIRSKEERLNDLDQLLK